MLTEESFTYAGQAEKIKQEVAARKVRGSSISTPVAFH
jgi:hypothetical protein